MSERDGTARFGNVPLQRVLSLVKEQNVHILGNENVVSLEHHTYRRVPGTTRSARFDAGDPGKNTKNHVHIFAMPDGKGKELLAVNCDGTGHDGHRGAVVPRKVAKFLESDYGFRIPPNLTLEGIALDEVEAGGYLVLIVIDDGPDSRSARPAYMDW